MTDPRGLLIVSARGQDWRLWLGMSVLAGIQSRHGPDWLAQLQPPAGLAPGASWLPPMQIVIDLLIGALERYHHDAADRWLADDIFAEDQAVLGRLIHSAFPDQRGDVGNGKGPKRAA
jgi:hypothetical protein